MLKYLHPVFKWSLSILAKNGMSNLRLQTLSESLKILELHDNQLTHLDDLVIHEIFCKLFGV